MCSSWRQGRTSQVSAATAEKELYYSLQDPNGMDSNGVSWSVENKWGVRVQEWNGTTCAQLGGSITGDFCLAIRLAGW